MPANVERYINLFQSSNILGGGDIAPGPGFHGHYASYNLKDRSEIIHINLDKFSRDPGAIGRQNQGARRKGRG